MALVRWQPFRERMSLMEQMNRMMDEMMPGWEERPAELGAWSPKVNVFEKSGNLVVEAELPGLEMSDLEILVTGGDQLSIRGVRRTPSDEGETWHRQERGIGQFSRLLDLPIGVDAERVEASLKNGVLTIKLPKREDAKPRKIAVTAG